MIDWVESSVYLIIGYVDNKQKYYINIHYTSQPYKDRIEIHKFSERIYEENCHVCPSVDGYNLIINRLKKLIINIERKEKIEKIFKQE